MSKYKIINMFDKIFISISIFLIIYAWINFFIRDLWITFLFSLVFSFACSFLLFYVINKKKEKSVKNKSYLADIEEKFLAFRLLDQFNKIKLLEIILSKDYKVEVHKDFLIYTKDNLKHQILIATESEKINQNQLINFIAQREKNVNILEIICSDFEPNVNTKILKNLDVVFITKSKFYDDYFLKANLFPDCSNLNTQKECKKFKEIMQNFLIPSKAKSYFLCGLILIFSSIILPYHTYYLIFGSVLLIFSIICKLQPLFKH